MQQLSNLKPSCAASHVATAIFRYYRWFIFDWGAIFCAGRLYWGVKKVRPNQKRRDDTLFTCHVWQSASEVLLEETSHETGDVAVVLGVVGVLVALVLRMP